jgi:hypothetical protein
MDGVPEFINGIWPCNAVSISIASFFLSLCLLPHYPL